jgi:DHA1 family multidrug resistance protein-like MFS transporter
MIRQAMASAMLNRGGLPLFGAFLVWGAGSGAQTLGRPLLAFEFTGSVFLVTLMISALALSRIVGGPLTGFLVDRIGRRPLAALGSSIRTAASVGDVFARNYIQFFALEMIGAIGLTMFNTTSMVIIADMSDSSNRGKAVALRSSALKLGQVAGPLLAGIVAYFFGLRYVFLINAVAKLIVTFIVLRHIAETKPEPEIPERTSECRTASLKDSRVILPILLTPGFAALTISTFGIHLMTQGVFQALFPIQSKVQAGLSDGDVGTLISIASVVTLIFALPNGIILDRFGRKRSLVSGLFMLSGAALLLAISRDYNGALAVAVLYGLAQSMTTGSSQTYAMDLAPPPDHRGAFLGVWSISQNLGAFGGTLAAGAIVDAWGVGVAFFATAGWLCISAIFMAVFGPETRVRSTTEKK